MYTYFTDKNLVKTTPMYWRGTATEAEVYDPNIEQWVWSAYDDCYDLYVAVACGVLTEIPANEVPI